MRTPYNDLVIEVYNALTGGTLIVDPLNELANAERLTFTKQYPGGLYSTCTFYVPRSVVDWWAVQGAKRIVIRNGFNIVWEGVIDNLETTLQETSEGVEVVATGYWGHLLGRRRWNFIWADDRVGIKQWYYDIDATGADKFQVSRSNGEIKIACKRDIINESDYAQVIYRMPIGETVDRLYFDYEIVEKARVTPKWVAHDAGTDAELTDTYDGDENTSVSVTLNSADYIYILCPTDEATGIRVVMGADKNATTGATLDVEYYNNAGAWASVTSISDGTDVGSNTPLGQSGDITWTIVRDSQETGVTVNSETRRGHWLRLSTDVTLDSADLNQIYVIYGQDYYGRIYRSTDGSTWTLDNTFFDSSTANTGPQSGSITRDIGTNNRYAAITIESASAQTQDPIAGTVYLKISNVLVYGDLPSRAFAATLDLQNVVEDVADQVGSELSADTDGMADPGLDLVPFVADRWQTMADIVMLAASYGDSSQNPWAAFIDHSERASDTKPKLYTEQQPALTDYDYGIRWNDITNKPPLKLSRDYDTIANWIVVAYTDENGQREYITPDEDANLKNTDSIASYGQRDVVVNVGSATSSEAVNYGRSYLAKYKDPQWKVSGPLKVHGFILGKNGNRIPASEIRPGKRLRVLNYLEDLSTDGLTLLISRVSYNDKSEVCSITVGVPDDLAVILAQLRKGIQTEQIRSSGGSEAFR